MDAGGGGRGFQRQIFFFAVFFFISSSLRFRYVSLPVIAGCRFLLLGFQIHVVLVRTNELVHSSIPVPDDSCAERFVERNVKHSVAEM